MRTDCHSHIIPKMDDGSKDIEMSFSMLEIMRQQGVQRVIATPHFYCHLEKSVDAYLQKRQHQFEKMMAAGSPLQNILLGAEVAIEKDLCNVPNIEKLAIQGTNLILLELPYAPYQDWMEEEIDNIAMTYHLVPVLAHVHRYLDWYPKEQIASLLQFDSIFQINAEAFESFRQKKIAKEIMRKNKPFLFGSDCHNLTDRRPNFDLLQKKVRAEMIRKSDQLLEQYLLCSEAVK